MVSPRVVISRKLPPTSPLFTIGRIDRLGKRTRIAPIQEHLPHLLCFKTAHDAAEVCRVANFCTRSVDFIDMDSVPVEECISMLVTSHEDLASEGWREYGIHECTLDTDVWKVKVVSTCIHYHPFRWNIESGDKFVL